MVILGAATKKDVIIKMTNKQYLLVVDEDRMQALDKVFQASIGFLEVTALTLAGMDGVSLIALPKVVTPEDG